MSNGVTKRTTQSRNWVLTKNNPEETLEEFVATLQKIVECTWGAGQLEKGSSGTPHFQYAFGTKSPTRLQTLIKRLPGCHIEVARSGLNAARYCQKPEGRLHGPICFG